MLSGQARRVCTVEVVRGGSDVGEASRCKLNSRTSQQACSDDGYRTVALTSHGAYIAYIVFPALKIIGAALDDCRSCLRRRHSEEHP